MAARRSWEPRGVGFLAVSVVADRAIVEPEIARLGYDLPQAVTTGDLLERVGVTGVPTLLFVSREGRVVAVAEGELSERALEDAISAIAAR